MRVYVKHVREIICSNFSCHYISKFHVNIGDEISAMELKFHKTRASRILLLHFRLAGYLHEATSSGPFYVFEKCGTERQTSE